jgi:hypothetical protein
VVNEKKRDHQKEVYPYVDNIENDLGEIRWVGMVWFHPSGEASCEHGNEPLGSRNFEKLLSSERLVDYQVGLISIVLVR